MGLLSWWKGGSGSSSSSSDSSKQKQKQKQKQKEEETRLGEQAAPAGMNGAVEVPPSLRRPPPPPVDDDITVFEFGSIAASSDKVTLAGFCPVSDDLQPCRWEILPAPTEAAPQFRVVF